MQIFYCENCDNRIPHEELETRAIDPFKPVYCQACLRALVGPGKREPGSGVSLVPQQIQRAQPFQQAVRSPRLARRAFVQRRQVRKSFFGMLFNG